MASYIADCDRIINDFSPPPRLCNSPTDPVDFDLHKYAVKNGSRMENRSFPCTSSDYVIELSDKLRKSEIIDMLIKNFLDDETLVKSLRVNANLSKSEEADFLMDENLLMRTVVEVGTVLVAINKLTNRISGALIIIVHDREKETKNNIEKKSHPYEGQLRSVPIKDFFKYIDKIEALSPDVLFTKYPNCKVYAEFELIAVNKLDRNKGLALDLYKAGLSVVKDMPDVSLLCGTYTSLYSQKIGFKIGKKILSKFDVTELKDDSDNPIFQDTRPHNFVTLMAMEI